MTESATTKSRSIFVIPNNEERAYFSAIDIAFTRRENRVISNGAPAHAVYLIFKFLSGARNNVKIYTGRLPQSINDVCAYRDPFVVMAAINFLRDPSAKLSIVIADELDVPDATQIDQHPLIHGILEAAVPGTFTVHHQNPNSQIKRLLGKSLNGEIFTHHATFYCIKTMSYKMRETKKDGNSTVS